MRDLLQFLYGSNTLDRDRVVVHAGWDSWAKIVVLRDGFDAKAWGEARERDLSSDARIDSDDDDGAPKMYASLVQDQGPKLTPLNNSTPERAFLAKNYDENVRPAQHLLPSHRRIHDAGHQPRRPLMLFAILASDRLARAGGDRGQQHAWRPRQRLRRTDVGARRARRTRDFFNSLLNPKDHVSSPETSAVSRSAATASGKPPAMGSRTSGASVEGGSSASASGSQADLDVDAGSGMEDGKDS